MTNQYFLYIYYILENINKIFSLYLYFLAKKYYYHHSNMIKSKMFFQQYLNIYFFYQIKIYLFSKKNIFVLPSPPTILFKKKTRKLLINPNNFLIYPKWSLLFCFFLRPCFSYNSNFNSTWVFKICFNFFFNISCNSMSL